jgi:hypothetical protein
MKIKLKPVSWMKYTGIDIFDPDGWDRAGDFKKDWNKPITFDEFVQKASESTTGKWPSTDNEELKRIVATNIINDL